MLISKTCWFIGLSLVLMLRSPLRGELPAPFTAAAFGKHVAYLADDQRAGRAPGTAGSAQALDYLRQQLQQAGLGPLGDAWVQPFPLESPAPHSGALFGKNLVAVWPGRGRLQSEAVIVSAHYDHLGVRARGAGADLVYNGADDNASGVAALLLLGEALGAEPPPADCRTVLLIAFDAEELGLLGSKQYLQRPRWPLEKTVAVINFDAIGRMRDDHFFAFDAETNPLLADTIRRAASAAGLSVETRLSGHGRSDHVPFQQVGIPGVHFFTGANIHYHQVTDTSDTINPAGGAAIARVGFAALGALRTLPGEIAFHPPNPTFHVQHAIELMQRLGMLPNVNAQAGRYPEILGVVPGSPAAQAGMRAGDQITSLNGLTFERVEEVLVILQQLSFAEGLRLNVLRGEEQVAIRLPASAFAGSADR
jgi:hypothetical protein